MCLFLHSCKYMSGGKNIISEGGERGNMIFYVIQYYIETPALHYLKKKI